MIQRILLDKLLAWKNKKQRKPLLRSRTLNKKARVKY